MQHHALRGGSPGELAQIGREPNAAGEATRWDELPREAAPAPGTVAWEGHPDAGAGVEGATGDG